VIPDRLSEAIELYLRMYPARNEDEFRAMFGAPEDRAAVRSLLDETMRLEIRADRASLMEIGEDVRTTMAQRHPELSDAALHALSNYFTYLVK